MPIFRWTDSEYVARMANRLASPVLVVDRPVDAEIAERLRLAWEIGH